jgi:hypothetical protein
VIACIKARALIGCHLLLVLVAGCRFGIFIRLLARRLLPEQPAAGVTQSMFGNNGHRIPSVLIAFVFGGGIAQASEYNAAHCQAVANTLNFHWESIAGSNPGCTGIEYTDGTFEEAASGSIAMAGLSVSNSSCIGTATYTLTLSADGMTLSGFDTKDNVPMTLTRGPGEECFVGHWVQGQSDFIGHIYAAPFLQRQERAAIPTLSGTGLGVLGSLIVLVAGRILARRRAADSASR